MTSQTVPDRQHLFQTKVQVPWPCVLCELSIQAGDVCYRLLDQQKAFPLICAACSGLAPKGDEPVCASCEEPIYRDPQDGTGWLHGDGESIRWKTAECNICNGRMFIKTPYGERPCERCERTGERQSFDHFAHPAEATP